MDGQLLFGFRLSAFGSWLAPGASTKVRKYSSAAQCSRRPSKWSVRSQLCARVAVAGPAPPSLARSAGPAESLASACQAGACQWAPS